MIMITMSWSILLRQEEIGRLGVVIPLRARNIPLRIRRAARNDHRPLPSYQRRVLQVARQRDRRPRSHPHRARRLAVAEDAVAGEEDRSPPTCQF